MSNLILEIYSILPIIQMFIFHGFISIIIHKIVVSIYQKIININLTLEDI